MYGLSYLMLKLKGSAGSGNFGHRGRKGKHGGSSSGGGLGALGLDRSSTVEERKRLASVDKRFNKVHSPTHEELSSYYDLENNCGKKINCEGFKDYTDFAHKDINRHLRFGDRLGYRDDVNIRLMDQAFNDLPTTNKEIKVKRSIDKISIIKGMVEGDRFVDKGYVSTSIKPDKEKIFGDIEIDIIVPKGSKGAYIEDITTHQKEHEFLLPRNAKFRVLRNDHLKPTDKTKNRVILEYLGSD